MTGIFGRAAHGEGGQPTGARLEAIILSRLGDGAWASATALHAAANNHAKRADMHEVLKGLLERRVIRMRVVSPNGREVTEFRLLGAA